MKRFFLLCINSAYRFLVLTVLVGIIGFSSGFSSNVQPALADISTPQQALKEIQKDQSAESPAKAYNEMTKIVEDPKVGIEKEYEKKEQEYFKSNPEEGGLVEQAKELVTKVKGSNEQ